MVVLESQGQTKINVLGHLEELRRRVLFVLAVFVVFSGIAFWKGDILVEVLRVPVRDTVGGFIFISPTEAFAAYIKMAVLAGFVGVFPVIVYHSWKFLSPAFTVGSGPRVFLWMTLALLLFYAGIGFSYFVAMPAALDFLIGFPGKGVTPSISLGEYVSFFAALIVCGGMVFQLPIVMGVASDLGIIRAEDLKKRRKYAVVAMMILAAIITPTHDMVNMLIFALPMIGLYEAGIMLSSVLEKKKK